MPPSATSKSADATRYVPPRKKRERPVPKSQPPLTPMIDVTFQLLLFFMVTFTFRDAEGLIPGTLPEHGETAQAKSVTDQPPIRVVVRLAPGGGGAVGAVFEFKGESQTMLHAEQLFQRLQTKREVAGSAQTPVVIEPRGDVPWEHVVNAFNQAVRAKFEKIGFASGA